jgi:hypothetical protein
VQEINSRHEVLLHAGNRVIGIHDPEVNTGGGNTPAPTTQFALELQTPSNPIDPAFRDQLFALDGDSIILAANHDLVMQVQNNRGATGAPVVVAQRKLADAEFWDFLAVDGVDRDPTSGFMRASSRDTLLNAITQINQIATNNGGASRAPRRASLRRQSRTGFRHAWHTAARALVRLVRRGLSTIVVPDMSPINDFMSHVRKSRAVTFTRA